MLADRKAPTTSWPRGGTGPHSEKAHLTWRILSPAAMECRQRPQHLPESTLKDHGLGF